MHELPVTESIVRICKDEVLKHNASKVLTVNIKVGELSGMVPDCIQYYFDIVSKDTVAYGARLNIEKVPLLMNCKTCGYEGPASHNNYNCPKCGGSEITLKGGREFYIDTMEVE